MGRRERGTSTFGGVVCFWGFFCLQAAFTFHTEKSVSCKGKHSKTRKLIPYPDTQCENKAGGRSYPVMRKKRDVWGGHTEEQLPVVLIASC